MQTYVRSQRFTLQICTKYVHIYQILRRAGQQAMQVLSPTCLSVCHALVSNDREM